MKSLKLYSLILVLIMSLAGCGGGGGSSGFTSLSNTTKYQSSISGYVEDDPIANATVTFYDNFGNVIGTATTDDNGYYSLDLELQENVNYYVNIKGTLNSNEIEMNAILTYAGTDIEININPLTEIKYQLVKNSGKSIDEAEQLIRDYFNIVKGKSLEKNRFSTSDPAYRGMKSIAELYSGILPIDAISKIKEDIIRNASLGENETKDYSFRSMVKKEISLTSTSTSLALGEEVQVNVEGIDELNSGYTLKWSGIPESATGTDVTKTFTISDIAQDVYVNVKLYKLEEGREIFLSSANIKVNFYEELEEKTFTLEDSTIENRFEVSESLDVVIPSNTLSNNETIKIVEQKTNSDTSLAQFKIDAQDNVAGNIILQYKYNPYLVSEPRNLQITLKDGDDLKVLNVNEIDYENNIVSFQLLLSSNVIRDLEEIKIYIEYENSRPDKDNIEKFAEDYKFYINDILEFFYGNDISKATTLLDSLYTDYGLSKLSKVLMEKDERFNDYKFNILARFINNKIAYKKAKEFYESSDGLLGINTAYSAFLINEFITSKQIDEKKSELENAITEEEKASIRSEISNLRTAQVAAWWLYSSNIVDLNNIISSWVGNIKLTSSQSDFVKVMKTSTNLMLAFNPSPVGKAEVYESLLGITGEILNYSTTPELTTDNAGYIYNLWANILNSTYKKKNLLLDGFVLSYSINQFYKLVENGLVLVNASKMAPIYYSVFTKYKTVPILEYKDENGYLSAEAIKKEDFLEYIFPFSEGNSLTNEEFKNNYYRNLILEAPMLTTDSEDFESQLSSSLDPNKIFEKLFLTKYASQTDSVVASMPKHDRAFSFLLLRYAFGDEEAGEIFKNFVDISYTIAFQYINQALYMDDDDITESYTNIFGNEKVRIKSEYDVSSIFRNDRSIKRINNNSSIYDIKQISTFQTFMQKAKLKLTNSQLEALTIKKVKLEIYGVGLTYNSEDNVWEIDESQKVNDTFTRNSNINSLFTYDSELEKNVLSFETLFSGEDFSQFDDKLVGTKITLVIEKSNGVEKVLSTDLVFTTLADDANLVQTNFTGATLKSSVKDAVSGEPIEGAFVTLTPGGLSSYTDANGNYEVSNLAAGNYTIVISKEGYSQIEASVILEEDETKIYEASLSVGDDYLNSNGTVTITTKDATTSNIITNGYIKIRQGQNNQYSETIEEEIINDGSDSIDVTLFPGIYTIEVGANGYTPSFSTVTIISETTVNKEISISNSLSEDEIRIVLTWGETPSDLDSHLVKKTGENEDYHIFFGDKDPANADANLDVDDTSSYGPETVTINGINENSIYTYYVHNFSGGEESLLPNSGAKIDVYLGNSIRTFYVPNEEGLYWKVFDIRNGNIVPCTENCVQSIDSDLVRSLNQEALLFKDLPSKK